MKKTVLYARVSSKEQEREGFSIPAQLKLLREYAVRNDFSILKEFVDIETAKTSGRQNFDEMVRFFAKHRDCRIVLVEKTDRLYRNFRDAVTLEDLDLEIHLVKEGQIISKDAKSQAKLSISPTYKKPFDLIFQRAQKQEWSGRADLNCRPLAPQASALPG
jgi:site-specific DNA recombinase